MKIENSEKPVYTLLETNPAGFKHLKAELELAFSAPDSDYIKLSADDILHPYNSKNHTHRKH